MLACSLSLRLESSRLRGCMQSWARLSRDASLLRHEMEARQRQRLRRLFVGWRQAASMRRRHHQAVRAFVGRRLAHALHSAMLAWRQLTARRLQLRSALCVKAANLRHRSLQRAMVRWMLHADNAKKQGRLVGAQAQLLCWRSPAAAFEAWSAFVAAKKLRV